MTFLSQFYLKTRKLQKLTKTRRTLNKFLKRTLNMRKQFVSKSKKENQYHPSNSQIWQVSLKYFTDCSGYFIFECFHVFLNMI